MLHAARTFCTALAAFVSSLAGRLVATFALIPHPGVVPVGDRVRVRPSRGVFLLGHLGRGGRGRLVALTAEGRLVGPPIPFDGPDAMAAALARAWDRLLAAETARASAVA